MEFLDFYLICFMIGSSLSCICIPYPDLEMEYCRSNFAIRGIARGLSVPNGEYRDRFYTIEVLEIFKAPSNVNVGDMLRGVTEGTSCGGFLWMNKEELILGSLNGTTYRFGSCTFSELFDNLDAKELNILKDGIKC